MRLILIQVSPSPRSLFLSDASPGKGGLMLEALLGQQQLVAEQIAIVKEADGAQPTQTMTPTPARVAVRATPRRLPG